MMIRNSGQATSRHPFPRTWEALTSVSTLTRTAASGSGIRPESPMPPIMTRPSAKPVSVCI